MIYLSGTCAKNQKIRRIKRMNLLKHYIMIFFVSMVPIVELRGAIPISQGFGLPLLQSYIICVIGNMLPVPVIFFFARKVLIWGKDKKFIGGFFTWCLDKGERGGEKLKEKAVKGRQRLICSFIIICWYSTSGHRRMDRNIGCKLFGYGL